MDQPTRDEIERLEARLLADETWRALCQLDARLAAGEPLTAVDAGRLRASLISTLEGNADYQSRQRLLMSPDAGAETRPAIPAAPAGPSAAIPTLVQDTSTIHKAPPHHSKAPDQALQANDDLTLIRTIDRALARQLAAHGIRSFDAIANFVPADIQALSAALGLGRRINQENWIEQAAVLAAHRPKAREPAVPLSSATPRPRLGAASEPLTPNVEPARWQHDASRIVRDAARAILARLPARPPSTTVEAPAVLEVLLAAPPAPSKAAPAASSVPFEATAQTAPVPPDIEVLITQVAKRIVGSIRPTRSAPPTTTEATPAAPLPPKTAQTGAVFPTLKLITTIAVPGPKGKAPMQPARQQSRPGSTPQPPQPPFTGDGSSKPAAASQSRTTAVTPPRKSDPMTLILGIDDRTKARLDALGITSFSQIAAWTPADVARYGDLVGSRLRVRRQGWIEQAAILAAGGSTHHARRVLRGEFSTLAPFPSSRFVPDPGQMARFTPIIAPAEPARIIGAGLEHAPSPAPAFQPPEVPTVVRPATIVETAPMDEASDLELDVGLIEVDEAEIAIVPKHGSGFDRFEVDEVFEEVMGRPERKTPRRTGNPGSRRSAGKPSSLTGRIEHALNRPAAPTSDYAAYRSQVEEAAVEIVPVAGPSGKARQPEHGGSDQADGKDSRQRGITRFLSALKGPKQN